MAHVANTVLLKRSQFSPKSSQKTSHNSSARAICGVSFVYLNCDWYFVDDRDFCFSFVPGSSATCVSISTTDITIPHLPKSPVLGNRRFNCEALSWDSVYYISLVSCNNKCYCWLHPITNIAYFVLLSFRVLSVLTSLIALVPYAVTYLCAYFPL